MLLLLGAGATVSQPIPRAHTRRQLRFLNPVVRLDAGQNSERRVSHRTPHARAYAHKFTRPAHTLTQPNKLAHLSTCTRMQSGVFCPHRQLEHGVHHAPRAPELIESLIHYSSNVATFRPCTYTHTHTYIMCIYVQ